MPFSRLSRARALACTVIGLVVLSASSTAVAVEAVRFFPLEAFLREVEGSALLRCRVLPGGKLEDCTVVSEAPVGYGFGRQALKMAPFLELELSKLPPPGGMVQVPIGFRFAGQPGENRNMRPVWTSIPDAAEVRRHFPPAAAVAKVSGAALVSCRDFASGSLSDCRTISELPSGYGFGPAAAELTGSFKIKPKPADSRSGVQIPVLFEARPGAVGFYADLRCFWSVLGRPGGGDAAVWFRARALQRMSDHGISEADQEAWLRASEEDYNADLGPSRADLRRCSNEFSASLRQARHGPR